MSVPEGYRNSWSASKEDVAMQIKCMDLGYKVYPKVKTYCKHWPNVVLAYKYRDNPELISKGEEFSQKYLPYVIHQMYYKLYENHIKTAVPKVPLTKVEGIRPLPPPMKRPGPPPPPKRMAAPPPPKS